MDASGSPRSTGRRWVTDTPPEERLKMGWSMGATARVLVRASILAQEPHASPAALRRALFLRFYGHELHVVEQEKILLRLGQDEPRPAGSTKRVA
jgi:hypothetical protein